MKNPSGLVVVEGGRWGRHRGNPREHTSESQEGRPHEDRMQGRGSTPETVLVKALACRQQRLDRAPGARDPQWRLPVTLKKGRGGIYMYVYVYIYIYIHCGRRRPLSPFVIVIQAWVMVCSLHYWV